MTQGFSKVKEEVTAERVAWRLKAAADIEAVSGRVKVMEERFAEFRLVAEGNKSDCRKVNSEINTLNAQLAVGRRAASRAADRSASD